MSSVDVRIGNLLRQAREHVGLTINDTAEELGLSPEKIVHMEAGRERPTPEQLIKISKLLRVQPAWFFPVTTDRDEPTPSPERPQVIGPDWDDGEPHLNSGIELVLPRNVRVRIAQGFDPTTLKQVLFALDGL
jgi:transcriptional regulator with XRE-family HTH domain